MEFKRDNVVVLCSHHICAFWYFLKIGKTWFFYNDLNSDLCNVSKEHLYKRKKIYKNWKPIYNFFLIILWNIKIQASEINIRYITSLILPCIWHRPVITRDQLVMVWKIKQCDVRAVANILKMITISTLIWIVIDDNLIFWRTDRRGI